MKLSILARCKTEDMEADLHYGYTDQENCFPFVPVERYNRKQTLQERYVEDCKVEGHGQSDCVNEDHVVPQR